MKKSEFTKLVRPIIKEELYKILGEVLPSLLSEVVAEQVVPNKPNKTMPVHKQPTKKSQQSVKFSSNPLLNEILNQTRGGISDGTELVGMDGQFEKIGENENPMMGHFGGSVLSEEDMTYSSGDHGQKVDLQEIQQVAPEVASALTRDYSSLMKAVDKKKRNGSPSNIDFANYNG